MTTFYDQNLRTLAKYTLVIAFFAVQYSALAQTNQKGADTTVLAKGRFTTTLYGFIQSQNIIQNINGTSINLENDEYTIGTNSGFFFHQNMVLGFNLWLKRTEAAGINYNINDEQLNIGMWYRWYFFNRKDISLYFDFTPYFVSIHQDNISNNVIIAESEELKGLGWGVAPGLGFVYFISRNVGFGMSMDYLYADVNATRTNLFENTTVNEKYFSNQLRFNFNFQIYLDQFFF